MNASVFVIQAVITEGALAWQMAKFIPAKNIKAINYFIAISLYFYASCSFAETEEVWIDVRTAFEHKLYSVDGDLRIDHDKIGSAISACVPELDTPVGLYCWMGFNVDKAKAALKSLGYTDVKAGAITGASQTRQ